MPFINIKTTEDDYKQVAGAINKLLQIKPLTYMSRRMLVDYSGIADTKLRRVLQDMLDKKYIEQYCVTENMQRQRYLYILTDTGRVLLS